MLLSALAHDINTIIPTSAEFFSLERRDILHFPTCYTVFW